MHLDHYTAAEQTAHGKKLKKAKEAVTEALRVAQVMAQSAASEGVPETHIAAELGVDRIERAEVGRQAGELEQAVASACSAAASWARHPSISAASYAVHGWPGWPAHLEAYDRAHDRGSGSGTAQQQHG